MSRHHEPNASHYAARYAERKRATERALDAASRPSPCNHCPTPRTTGSIFCATHAAEYSTLCGSGVSSVACAEFCRRTYWPGDAR